MKLVAQNTDLSAVLSNLEIEEMAIPELAQFVRRADLPHLTEEVATRLPLYDHATLRRLAYQARECCRKRAESVT